MNRVPPEVITLCAAFVSPTDPRPLISLTHVCRYWRNAIASSPGNWASIGSGWKRLAPLCLERAGVVPLTVEINTSVIHEDETFLKAIPSHTSRIARLSLTGYSSIEAAADIIPTFFTSTMDSLTSLELHQTSRPAEIFPSGTSPAPQISWKLSKLTSLHLTQTPLYPAIASITSLVELNLAGYTTPFHFRKFIGFLKSNPDLQSIALDILFVEYPMWVGIPSTRISLPRLRHLSFTCINPTDTRILISSINLPRGASLEVVGSQVNPHHELDLFLPPVPTQIEEMLGPITTIKYQYRPGVVQFHGNDSCLSFRCSDLPIGYQEFWLFAVASVREFHLNTTSCHDLSRPLSQLPALETLVLVDVSTFPAQAFNFLTEEPVLCPSLKTIAFFDCNLSSGAITALEAAVAGRKNSGAAWLHRIVIVRKTGALPSHTLIHRLRQSVPCIDARIDEKLPDLS